MAKRQKNIDDRDARLKEAGLLDKIIKIRTELQKDQEKSKLKEKGRNGLSKQKFN